MTQIILVLSILGIVLSIKRARRCIRYLIDIKIIRFILIPILLIGLWMYASIIQIQKTDNVVLLLTSEYSSNSVSNVSYEELLKGQGIRSQFTATHDYLGIVGVRFWNFYRLNSDVVEFKIKRVGEKDWFYTNTHKTDQFQPHDYFVFGFPVEKDSNGKKYEFTVTSLNGQPGDAVGISPLDPMYVVKYKYPREAMQGNIRMTVEFIFIKIMNTLARPKLVATIFIFVLPLLIYILFILNLYEYKTILSSDRINKSIIQFLLILAMILDIFVIKMGEETLLITFFIWIFVNIHYIKNKYVYVGVPLLYLLSFFAHLIGTVNLIIISERAMVWSFLFFAFEIIHIVINARLINYQKAR